MTMLADPPVRQRPELAETRSYHVEGIELRADESDPDSPIVHFHGIASVVNHPYPMYGGKDNPPGWDEYIDKGAFTKTLSEHPLVNFVINHVGMSLARTQKLGSTKPPTLSLAENDAGDLAVDADLDRRQTAVSDLVIAMERGDIDEMSFKFRVIRDVWLTEDGEEVPWWDLDGIERHIKEVSLHKGDVSVVNFGANDATSADLRDLEGALGAIRCGRPLTPAQRAALDRHIDAPIPDRKPADPTPAPTRGMTVAQARRLAHL